MLACVTINVLSCKGFYALYYSNVVLLLGKCGRTWKAGDLAIVIPAARRVLPFSYVIEFPRYAREKLSHSCQRRPKLVARAANNTNTSAVGPNLS